MGEQGEQTQKNEKKKPLERNRVGEICFWVDIVTLRVMVSHSEQLFPKEPH